MNKKLLLSLSTATLSFAPIMTVLACSDKAEDTTVKPLIFAFEDVTYNDLTNVMVVNKTITNFSGDKENATPDEIKGIWRDAFAWAQGLMAHSVYKANYATATSLLINGISNWETNAEYANLKAFVDHESTWVGKLNSTSTSTIEKVKIWKSYGIDSAQKYNVFDMAMVNQNWIYTPSK